MKQNDLSDAKYTLSSQHYENIFNVYEDQDIGYFFNLLRTVNFPDDPSPDTYDIYVVQPQDTWPLISWKVYNSVLLWWVICAFNNIENPLDPLIPGGELKILRGVYLKNILANLKAE